MVEVTQSNFSELFPEIKKAIKNCTFIAIDTEFTGLDLEPTNAGSLFDDMEERYKKLKNRATAFIPCQIGLSTFFKEGKENKFLVQTYVFFIRPRKCGSINKRFMFEASALDFLSRYEFDFNKFIHDGIPYINEDEIEEVKKEIENGTIGYSHASSLEIKPRREQDILINTKFNFLKSENGEVSNSMCSDNLTVTFPKDKMCHEYLQLCELRRKYPSLWAYCEGDVITVQMVTAEKRKELETSQSAEIECFLDYFIGFTKVFRIIKEIGKPIVGHNVLMDLMLLFQNFHKNLPNSYSEFKTELHSIFPVIFDTRHIWLNVKKFYKFENIPKFAGLFDLYEMFKSPVGPLSTLFSPLVQHSNCDKYTTEKFPHESGYDSYITGWVFLKICHVLAMKKITNATLIQPQTFKQHLAAVFPFKNKLNVGRLRIRFIDLDGDDPQPQVADFLHISPRSSRKVLNHQQLCSMLDRFPLVEFKMAANKRSAVLVVGNVGIFKDILREFRNDPDFKVVKYSFFRHSYVAQSVFWLTSLASMCAVAFYVGRHLSQHH